MITLQSGRQNKQKKMKKNGASGITISYSLQLSKDKADDRNFAYVFKACSTL